MTDAPTLAQIVALLEARYPPETAEDWDAVGLVVGDPTAPVRKVLLAVDPVREVVDEALAWGADLLLTHHPLLLRGVHSVAADTLKGQTVHALISGGCALLAAHTNADAAARGVAQALADTLGLLDTSPLDPAPGGTTGHGRVGRLPSPTTLRDFARHVAAVLPATAQGIRVAGDLDASVSTVAVLGGSGDSYLAAARARGVDVYLTSDLKHHAVSDAREQAALDAVGQGRAAQDGRPFLVDTAHFASEWPWLEHAASDLVHDLAATGTTVETRISTVRTDPWTARFARDAG